MKNVRHFSVAAFAAVLSAALSLASCGSEDKSGSVSFSVLSDAAALGATESSVARYARAAGASEGSQAANLIKLRQDGTLENASSTEGTIKRRGNIKGIIKPPVGGDVYIWYDNPWYDGDGQILSTLVCVHSDGTFTNVLMENSYFGYESMFMESSNCLQFAKDGTAYISAREGGGIEYYIYRFDPKTKVRTTLLSSKKAYQSDEAIDRYSKFMLSADEKTIFVEGDRSDTHTPFLKRVSVSNPELQETIFTGQPADGCVWTYDGFSNKIYVSARGTKCFSADADYSSAVSVDSDTHNILVPTEKGVYGIRLDILYSSEKGSMRQVIFVKNLGTAEEISFEPDIDMHTFGSVLDIFGKTFEVHGDYIFFAIYGIKSGYSIDYNTYSQEERQEKFDGNYDIYMRMAHRSVLYRFDLNAKTVENVLKNSPYKDNTNLTAWSANDTELYYSSYSDRNPVSGKIDVSDPNFTHTKIDSSQALFCLAAM